MLRLMYTTVAVQEEGLWGVTCPAIPGVFGIGKTRPAAEADFIEALNALLDYLGDVGEKLPVKPEGR